jgi:uncharacterized membrane protein
MDAVAQNVAYHIDWTDVFAFVFFVLCWLGYARYSEHERFHKTSLLAVTNRYRMDWMQEMLKRDNRSVDAIMVGNLQRSITFFANTTIFLLIGLMTMLGYHDLAEPIISNIPYARLSSPFMWQMKILLLMVLFIYAFFKYTWSLRQYNYAAIFIVACPEHNKRVDEHQKIAARGTYLIGNAAKHFNSGLRAYYFGLAALAWFIHPYLFMVATALVVFVTHRREYHSQTLKNLAKE